MTSQPDIICSDSLAWMKENEAFGHVITSLPAMAELSFSSEDDYENWFVEASRRCFRTSAPGCITAFIQTDELRGGRWFSKPERFLRDAWAFDRQLMWHKIELRRDVDKIDLYRPAYRHVLAFGDGRCRVGKRRPDVFYEGSVLYKNGNGVNSSEEAIRLARLNDPHETILDPFCGRGTVIKVAKDMGMRALGIDIDERQCELARELLTHEQPIGLDFTE